jgi:hypothetical protein
LNKLIDDRVTKAMAAIEHLPFEVQADVVHAFGGLYPRAALIPAVREWTTTHAAAYAKYHGV